MELVKFNDSDIEKIVSLFYDTVHSVNAKDYSQTELDAWAPRDAKESKVKSWKESLDKNITYVAKINDEVVGFSNLTYSGHLDLLYVHKDYQGQGIATALVNQLESEARKLNLLEVDTEASITAKPFFEQRGYKIVCSQIVERNGVKLTNYKMIKEIKV